jgi:hypothetical protein
MGPRRKLLRWSALGALTLLGVGLLGACTASEGGGGSAGANAGSVPGPGAVAAPPHAAVKGAPAGGGSGYGGEKQAGPAGSTDGTLANLDLGEAKIRVANMTVQVKHGESVAGKADAAEAIATAVGGEVDSDDRTSGKYPTATLLLRVPPENLTSVLHQLSVLGVEKSRELSTRDVTSKVADVNSRVASARAAINRLRVLYQHAHKVGNVITIEDELNQRESDLESLQAQSRALAAETTTAAITLALTSPPAPAPKPTPKPIHHHRSGFVGGLLDGWHAFTKGVSVLATIIGAVLPFAVLLLVLAVLARLLWPRLRPAPRSTPESTGSSSAA